MTPKTKIQATTKFKEPLCHGFTTTQNKASKALIELSNKAYEKSSVTNSKLFEAKNSSRA